MFLVQVTVWSPLSSYPPLQLRDRTVPVETGNCLSAFMFVQVVFRPVQSRIITFNKHLAPASKHCKTIFAQFTNGHSNFNSIVVK